MFGCYARRRLTLAAAVLSLVVGGLRFAAPSPGAAARVAYTVQTGDTLWDLARRSGDGDPRAVVERIRDLNHLGDVPLRPGRRLLLPAPS